MKKRKFCCLLLVLFVGYSCICAQLPRLSRAQALADLDALVSGMKEIHPDLFFVCPERVFEASVDSTRKAFPDSMTVIDFYKYAEPLTSMLGDGHTQLYFPKETVKQNGCLLFPLTIEINLNDSTVMVADSYRESGTVIAKGSRILSINGMGYRSIIQEMMKYGGGERPFFRLSKIDRDFINFLYMLYPAEEYRIECENKGVTQEFTVRALPYSECSFARSEKGWASEPYTYRLMEPEGVAIMEFDAFMDADRFRYFTDSLFSVLKEKQIRHLIIDIRKNGGGDSDLGDELLQYISPVPFKQFGKQVIRYSDLQKKLALQLPGSSKDYSHKQDGIEIIEETDEMIPLRENPLRYQGKVYLLVGHTTFSSASSLSWAFQNFKLGPVIGEETGGMSVCFGDIVILQLPYSKINSTISFARMYMYKASDQEIHGTVPDKPFPAEKALQYTLRLISGKPY